MTEPSCNCVTCPDCSKTYKADDDEGVSVAATDELAEHHDRKCSACWKKIES